MIRAEGLTKYYALHRAIEDVSFEVDEGEIVAFLGPNGAGKTTTMRILTGYLPPTLGQASIAGFDVQDQSLDARRHVGYVPEATALYTDMRVRQYLRYAGRLQGMGSAELKTRMDYVVDHCGLRQRADAVIGTLSLGYRQRVGLAQALLHDPPVLVLDEPTAGMDPNQIVEVRDLIRGLAGDHTVLLSTHILPEVQMTCERAMIISLGRIIAMDTPEALTARVRGGQTVMLRVRADGADVPELIRAVPGVRGVRAGGSPGAYHVDMETGADLRPELAELVVAKGWGLLELRPVEVSLEEVFRELTTVEEMPAGSVQTARPAV